MDLNIDMYGPGNFRFKILGDKLQIHRAHAFGLAFQVWAVCYQQLKTHLTAIEIDAAAEVGGFHLAMVEAMLAKPDKDNQFYINGTRDRMPSVVAWFHQRRDQRRKRSKAGRKRAETANRNKNGIFTSSITTSTAPAQHQHGAGGLHQRSWPSTAAASATASVSNTEKENTGAHQLTLVAPAKPPAVPKKSKFDDATRLKMRDFIARYAELYRAKYNAPPESLHDKALMGKIGHWIESVSSEKATQLVEVYMQIDFKPINDSMHDLWLFFRNLNRIGVALASGQDASGINWGAVFGRKA